MPRGNGYKVFIGIGISLLFLYLAFRKVDFGQFLEAISAIHLPYLFAAVIVILISFLLRVWRWYYLLLPIAPVRMSLLFNSLMIGYMFNTFLPAHLGEFVRAYVVGQKSAVPAGTAFATIVIERILDVFSLVILMALSLIVFPFPNWVKTSGYLSFLFIALLFLFLVFLKIRRQQAFALLQKLFRPLPERLWHRTERLLHTFLEGIVGLKKPSHYLILIILTIAMWGLYIFVFQCILWAFEFVAIYQLPWYTALILVVITTISIVVPSSPGYVGTYHYLCQLTLGLFSVPGSPALSFAVIMHGLNVVPVLILGLIVLPIEGLDVRRLKSGAAQLS